MEQILERIEEFHGEIESYIKYYKLNKASDKIIKFRKYLETIDLYDYSIQIETIKGVLDKINKEIKQYFLSKEKDGISTKSDEANFPNLLLQELVSSLECDLFRIQNNICKIENLQMAKSEYEAQQEFSSLMQSIKEESKLDEDFKHSKKKDNNRQPESEEDIMRALRNGNREIYGF